DAISCMYKMLDLKDQGVNIRVVNDSWGGGGGSLIMRDAFKALYDHDIVSAVAAGNFSSSSDQNPGYPASYDVPGIVSVGASNRADTLAFFSTSGFRVDLLSPGDAVLSTLGPCPYYRYCSDTGYGLLSGTSMATPHVAGVLAAIFQENP